MQKENGLLQSAATAHNIMYKLCIILHSMDVGAVNGRPRATNRRPYRFYG